MQLLVKCVAVLSILKHCADGRLGVIELALAVQMAKEKLTPASPSSTTDR